MSYEIVNRFRAPSRVIVIDDAVTINLGQLSANVNTENVTSAQFSSLKWSVHPTEGNLQISRDAGGGPVVVANLFQTGFWSHDELNISNTATGNITITITGSGTAVLEVSKHADYNVDTSIL